MPSDAGQDQQHPGHAGATSGDDARRRGRRRPAGPRCRAPAACGALRPPRCAPPRHGRLGPGGRRGTRFPLRPVRSRTGIDRPPSRARRVTSATRGHYVRVNGAQRVHRHGRSRRDRAGRRRGRTGRGLRACARACSRVAHRGLARARHEGPALACAARPRSTGGLTELAWVGAHVLMYPLGTRTEPPAARPAEPPGDQPPAVRALFAADPLAARIPVLLVHGLVDNRSVFTVMQPQPAPARVRPRLLLELQPAARPTSPAARADLGEHIERICEQTGHDRVHVVGHSLGGLIARYHVQRQGGDRRVAVAGDPRDAARGSRWAHVVPTPLVRQLRPGSAVFQELAEPAPGCRTRDHRRLQRPRPDGACPTSSGRCDHPDLAARNVLVRGVGHMTLPRAPRACVDEVAATLAGRRPARPRPAGRAEHRRRLSGRAPPPRPHPGARTRSPVVDIATRSVRCLAAS